MDYPEQYGARVDETNSKTQIILRRITYLPEDAVDMECIKGTGVNGFIPNSIGRNSKHFKDSSTFYYANKDKNYMERIEEYIVIRLQDDIRYQKTKNGFKVESYYTNHKGKSVNYRVSFISNKLYFDENVKYIKGKSKRVYFPKYKIYHLDEESVKHLSQFFEGKIENSN